MTAPTLTVEEAAALDVARALATAGIPVFVAAADATNATGFALPARWQHVTADPAVVDLWRPGMAIAAVMGQGLDVIDVDPRNGGDPASLNGRTPVSYGAALTPSGGVHSFIRSLGVRKKTNVLPGIDIQAGAPDGSGRGFVFLAPTIRISKTTGVPVPYRWAAPPDLHRWQVSGPGDVSGFALAELVRGAGPAAAVGAPSADEFMKTGPWANIEAALAGGRNEGVARLAQSLRGRGGWRLDDAVRYMYAEVWPLLDQAQGGHPFTGDEFEATIAAQFKQYPDGQAQRQAEAAVPPQVGDGLLQPPSMLRYFTEKNSLQAATLAADVASLGPLADGSDDRMWSYHGGVWRSAKHIVRDRVTFLLGERYRSAHVRNVEDIVRSRIPRITCDPIPDIVNVRNGLLDWSTGALREHTPELLTTVQLAVDYDPAADCPAFEQFLSQVVPADVVDTVWELIGYLMYSGNPLHKAVMLTGTGRNGKGTFLRVMVRLLGTANVTSASLQDLVNTRFTTASLFGKLANIAGDIDGGYLENTATLKAITGGDVISAEHKGRDRFDFTPWAVPVFSANRVPASADTTVGYLSRWLIVNFPHDFTGREDRHLDARLCTQAELNGIATRALAALPRLLERGDFLLTDSARAAREEFVRRVDQVRTWLFDCAELDPELPFVARTELYQAYQRWAARDGHRPVKASEFYDRLESAGAVPTAYLGTRGFKGIKITDTAHLINLLTPGAQISNSKTGLETPAPVSGLPAPEAAPDPTDPKPSTTTVDIDPPSRPAAGDPAAPGCSPADTGAVENPGAVGAADSYPHVHARAGDALTGGWATPAPTAPDQASTSSSYIPFSAQVTAKLLEAKTTGPEPATPPSIDRPAPPATTPTSAAEQMSAEYHELRRQQDLRVEKATRGHLTNQRGKDSEEVLRYFGEGEFEGDQVEPRLTYGRFLEQRRTGRAYEKAQQTAYDAGARLGRRHAAQPSTPDQDADYTRAGKGRDEDAFADGYRAGITEHTQAITDASGNLIDLPALVTRGGTVRPLPLHEITLHLESFGARNELTVDVETTGFPLGHADYDLRTVQLGGEHVAAVFDAHDTAQMTAAADLLARARVLHAHSATADLVPLEAAGLVDDAAWERMHDTVIAAKLADPASTGSDPGLKQLAGAVLGDAAVSPAADDARAALFKAGKWLTDTKATTAVDRSGWAQVDPFCTTMVRYAASDVLDTAALAHRLPSVPPAVLERERTAQRMTARVTYRGLRIDGDHVTRLLEEHTTARAAAAQRVHEHGVDNPGSNPQVGAKLLELGALLPATATGKPSVAEGVLDPMRNIPGPIGQFVADVLTYRHHDTALGTFLEPYHQLVTRGDGRARPTIYTLAADTGRMSCVRPNLQQVPREGGFRACITADPGTLLVSADFAGVELRVAAALSGDTNLRRMLAEGIDVHWEIARLAFGPDATKSDRYAVKRGVFGRIYGGGIPAIAKGVGVSETVAAAIIDALDAMLPELAAWSRTIRDIVKNGQTQFPTYAGRVIHLPQRFPHKAPNYCIQGTARELLVDTLVRLRDTRWADTTLLPVHDELLLVVPEADAQAATNDLVAAMETDLYGVAIKAEASTPSYAWADAS